MTTAAKATFFIDSSHQTEPGFVFLARFLFFTHVARVEVRGVKRLSAQTEPGRILCLPKLWEADYMEMLEDDKKPLTENVSGFVISD